MYLQYRRNGANAKRFFKHILRRHGSEPRNIVIDKMKSYGVAYRELIPDTTHNTDHYANNRAEQSQSLPPLYGYEATRVKQRVMRRFKSVKQAQSFLDTHAAVNNLFNLARYLITAKHYRSLREDAFENWGRAVA